MGASGSLRRVLSLPLAASRSLRLAGIVARLQGTFTARRLRFRPAHSEDRSRGHTSREGARVRSAVFARITPSFAAQCFRLVGVTHYGSTISQPTFCTSPMQAPQRGSQVGTLALAKRSWPDS